MGKKKTRGGEEGRTESPERQTIFKNYKLQRFSEEEDAEQFVREVRLLLRLQPMTDSAAVGWILNAIDGQPKKELLMKEPSEINNPEKILVLLLERWGDQRTGSALATAFLSRKQRSIEDVAQYAAALKTLWRKVNESCKGDAFSLALLKDTFAQGLKIPALRQETRRYLREHTQATFEEVEKEALRWMREDCKD